jgi:hypothetical protein
MVLNSSNVRIYRNTFVNSMACIGRNARSAAGDRFGWHPSTGPDVDKREGHVFVDNLLAGDESFTRPFLFVWQPEALCTQLHTPQVKEADHNVYVRGRANSPYPMILWSPDQGEHCQAGFASSQELHKAYAAFSSDDKSFLNYDGPLFKGKEVGDYRLLDAFPGSRAGASVPPEIRKFLEGDSKAENDVGAYRRLP